ncbi:hypothetical protein, partial [Burkholderia gladioli]|uniref:hypothetical protein n=1 Tax=Burkholderia gladioli TaxID=28095 RepID=UPI0039EAADBB
MSEVDRVVEVPASAAAAGYRRLPKRKSRDNMRPGSTFWRMAVRYCATKSRQCSGPVLPSTMIPTNPALELAARPSPEA